MMCKNGNIVGTFLERRQIDLNDIQTIIKIITEFSILYFFTQISIRGRNNSYIDFDWLRHTNRRYFSLL